MKEIKLTRGFVALVDDEEFEYLNQFKWHAHKCGSNKIYAKRMIRVKGIKGSLTVLMHRDIMEVVDQDNIILDHKDGNGLNNQKANLRIATPTQNRMNSRPHGKIKYKGVYLNKGKYMARIRLGNKPLIYLGRFSTPEDAARAYDKAAAELFGEFAHLNNI